MAQLELNALETELALILPSVMLVAVVVLDIMPVTTWAIKLQSAKTAASEKELVLSIIPLLLLILRLGNLRATTTMHATTAKLPSEIFPAVVRNRATNLLALLGTFPAMDVFRVTPSNKSLLGITAGK